MVRNTTTANRGRHFRKVAAAALSPRLLLKRAATSSSSAATAVCAGRDDSRFVIAKVSRPPEDLETR
jgi:hypothetical protein